MRRSHPRHRPALSEVYRLRETDVLPHHSDGAGRRVAYYAPAEPRERKQARRSPPRLRGAGPACGASAGSLSNTVDTEDTDRILRSWMPVSGSGLRRREQEFRHRQIVTGVEVAARRHPVGGETIRNVSGDSGGQAGVDEVIEILVQQGFSATDRAPSSRSNAAAGGEPGTGW